MQPKKISKESVMRRAHQIRKGLTGHYHATMSAALKQAWQEAKDARLVQAKMDERLVQGILDRRADGAPINSTWTQYRDYMLVELVMRRRAG